MNKSHLNILMNMAFGAASRSKAERKKVGFVLVDANDSVIDYGYNGSVRGHEIDVPEFRVRNTQCPTNHDEEGPYEPVTDESMMIHAEWNAIAHAARRGISTQGGSGVGTLSPCMKCTGLLIQCGLKEVIYDDEHRSFSEVEKTYGRYIKLTKWNAQK